MNINISIIIRHISKMQNTGITEIVKERALTHGTDTKILANTEKESESNTIKKMFTQQNKAVPTTYSTYE
jgi:hypothetical protein